MDQSPTLFEKKSFGGSFTDNIYSNNMALCGVCDNLLVNNNEKLYVRPGSTTLYPAVSTLYSTGYKINRLIKYRDDHQIFAGVGPKLYYDTGSGWTNLQGTPAHDAFVGGTDSHYWSYGEWNGFLFLTHSKSTSKPIKVYADDSSNLQLRTAGLPAVPADPNYVEATLLASAISMANFARTAFLAHYANTSAHPVADTTASGLLTSGACSNLATLKTLVTQLLTSYASHIDSAFVSGTTHYGKLNNADVIRTTESDQRLLNVRAPETLLECCARLVDLKVKVEAHWYTRDLHNSTAAEIASSFYTAAITDLMGYYDGPSIDFGALDLYKFANTIKARLNAHFASADLTVPYTTYTHNVAADATNTIGTADATTPATLRDLFYQLFVKYDRHADDAQDGVFTYHAFHIADTNSDHKTTPWSDDWAGGAFISDPNGLSDQFVGVSAGNFALTISRLNNLKSVANEHILDGVYPLGPLFPHGTTTTATKTNIIIPGDDFATARYVYGFCLRYDYTVGDVTYIDRGPMMIVVPNLGVVDGLEGIDEVAPYPSVSIDYAPQFIGNIPTFANGAEDNYDVGNIYIEIYRTINNGTVLYYVDKVINGTNVYTDRVKDAELQTREPAYTTGGVLDNDPPPIAKCIHIVNDKAYYGNLTHLLDSGEYESLPNQVRESIAQDPDSVPAASYANLPDAVIGISSFKSIPIVCCDNSIHRLEGGFDELGRGALVPQIISETIGCLSEASIVRTEYGVFFAGTDGFYQTDGYQIQKISKDWNASYLAWTATDTQKANICGAYDPHQLRVWWGITTTGTVNNKCVILDLNYPLAPTPTWTTASGDIGNSWKPSALMFSERLLYRGDSRGYIFTHTDSNPKTDPHVNTALAPSSWSTQAVVWDYQSTLMDFGTGVMRKWAPWVHAQFHTSGNSFYCEPQTKVEATENSWFSLARTDKNNPLTWGDNFLQWGASSYVWNEAMGVNFVAIKRAFPATTLRFTHKQVRFKLPYLLAHDSTLDPAESVSISGSAVTVTGISWPSYITSWYISFSNESYATEYLINRVNSSSVITVTGTPTAGSGLGFKVYGYPKDVDFELLDYQITGAPLDKTQEGSRSWQV